MTSAPIDRVEHLPVAAPDVTAMRSISERRFFGLKDTFMLSRCEAGTAELWTHGRLWQGRPGKRLQVPVVSESPEEAAAHFGWFSHFAQLDRMASSARTRAMLGWTPAHPDLLADLDRPADFASADARVHA